MTAAKSTGTCALCHKEFSKVAMTRHLATCLQRLPRRGRAFHVLVEGRHAPVFWLHVLVADVLLAHLDRFLRAIWLECCGHMSAFEIGGSFYCSGADGAAWDTGDENMEIQVRQVLRPGLKFGYQYDFGSTTALALRVVGQCASDTKEPVRLIARNNPPLFTCACGKPAIHICPECACSGEAWLCVTCASDHECGEDMLLPVVNSPRVGVCGYTG
jgi:hypothetical protein